MAHLIIAGQQDSKSSAAWLASYRVAMARSAGASPSRHRAMTQVYDMSPTYLAVHRKLAAMLALKMQRGQTPIAASAGLN